MNVVRSSLSNVTLIHHLPCSIPRAVEDLEASALHRLPSSLGSELDTLPLTVPFPHERFSGIARTWSYRRICVSENVGSGRKRVSVHNFSLPRPCISLMGFFYSVSISSTRSVDFRVNRPIRLIRQTRCIWSRRILLFSVTFTCSAKYVLVRHKEIRIQPWCEIIG